jgi:uncharacterized heparinase superfamily protein
VAEREEDGPAISAAPEPAVRRGAVERLLLYGRTARHLKPVQLATLPLRRLQALRPALPPSVEASLSPGAEALAAAVRGWPAQPGWRARADEVAAGTFRFLNHAEQLPRVDWRRRHVSHLWSYNLHYFAYGVDLARAWAETGDPRYARCFAVLADGWMEQTAGGEGDGWEPYAVSLRVVHWAYALLLFGGGLDSGVRARMIRSLASQLGWLERRLEVHIQANHLQKNHFALLVGGLLLDGRHAARWRGRGAAGTWRALGEQTLPDGGHYERSPMYHAIALADFLEAVSLLRAAGEAVPAEARERLGAMVRATGVLTRPDGRLHLFNDAAEGIAPARAWLDALARQTVGAGIPAPAGVLRLPDTGYWGWQGGDDERLLVDCGVPGPAHQPGHAHCDLLSYELDLGGRPVVVDAGVHGYEGDPLREYVRSTRAHNTVTVGGREQSEVWGTFRLARRARPLPAAAEGDAERFRFTGGCRPYHGAGVHHREIVREDGAWHVRDRVQGAAGAPVASWLHLHPDFAAERHGGDALLLRAPGCLVRVAWSGFDRVRVHRGETRPAQGWHCPEFGRALPAVALEMARDRDHGAPFGYSIRFLQAPE